MSKMTKNDLVAAVAESAGMSKSEAEGALEAFFSVTADAVKDGGEVAWPGFGKFSRSERAARTGRNPQTGESIEIAASKGMKFSSSSALKKAMNT